MYALHMQHAGVWWFWAPVDKHHALLKTQHMYLPPLRKHGRSQKSGQNGSSTPTPC